MCGTSAAGVCVVYLLCNGCIASFTLILSIGAGAQRASDFLRSQRELMAKP